MSEEFPITQEFPTARYTSFWPLVIFLTGSVIWTSFEIYQINQQRLSLIQQTSNSADLVKQSDGALNKLANLGQDILQVSVNDTNAAVIVREYGIRANANAVAPKTPSPTPAPTPAH